MLGLFPRSILKERRLASRWKTRAWKREVRHSYMNPSAASPRARITIRTEPSGNVRRRARARSGVADGSAATAGSGAIAPSAGSDAVGGVVAPPASSVRAALRHSFIVSSGPEAAFQGGSASQPGTVVTYARALNPKPGPAAGGAAGVPPPPGSE